MDAWSKLGVNRDTSLPNAKAAWRAAARRHHPDRGGDAAAFMAAQEAWESIKQAQPPPPPSTGRAAAGAPVARRPWNHLRAVEHLVEIDGLDIDTMEDGTTGFSGPGGVIWASDADIEWDGYGVPWSLVDDVIMADVVELLLGLDG